VAVKDAIFTPIPLPDVESRGTGFHEGFTPFGYVSLLDLVESSDGNAKYIPSADWKEKDESDAITILYGDVTVSINRDTVQSGSSGEKEPFRIFHQVFTEAASDRRIPSSFKRNMDKLLDSMQHNSEMK